MAAFETFGSAAESQIASFASETSSALIASLGPPAAAALTIYFTARAWQLWFEGSRGSFGILILECVRAGFIAFFALSSGHFAAYAIQGAAALESFLLSAVPGHPASAWGAIDVFWETACEGIAALWNLIGTFGVTRIGEELLLAAAVAVMTALGVVLASASLGVILIAKIALTVTLAFGPVFIASLFFRQTAGFFSGWLHSLLTHTVTLAAAGAVILLFTGIFRDRISAIAALASAPADGDIFGVWLQLGVTLALSLTAGSVIRCIPSAAAAMTQGGGAAPAVSAGALVSGAVQPVSVFAGGALTGYGLASGRGTSETAKALLGGARLSSSEALFSAAGGAAFGSAARMSRRIRSLVRASS